MEEPAATLITRDGPTEVSQEGRALSSLSLLIRRLDDIHLALTKSL